MNNIFSFFFLPSRKRCLTISPNAQEFAPSVRSPRHPMLKLLFTALPHRYASAISQSLLLGLITTTSVISSTLSLNSKAYAQTAVNNTEINSYAQAVLAMEPARQHAFEEIKKLIGGGEIPQIVCNDGNSINGLPRKAQDIAVNYCTRSQKIVEDNGLSIDRFNKITMEAQSNNNLKRQIYNTLLRLQKAPDFP